MRIHFLAVSTSVVLASCFGAERFDSQLFEARCDWSTECYPDVYTSRDLCPRAELDGDECEFQADPARDCLDAWDALTCDEPTHPDVCDTVYKCPSGEADTDTDTDTDTDARADRDRDG